MKKIVVVGSLNMDIVTTVRALPKPGETISSTSLSTIPGGKGANQAVCAARLGAQVKMIGKVGADEYGTQLIQTLKDAGIEIGGIQRVGQTGMAFIQVSEDGENSIVLFSGANGQLIPVDIEEYTQVIEESDYILMQLEIPYETVYYTLKKAAIFGKKVVLNPAPAVLFPDEWYEMVDTLTPNETELSLLTNREVNNIDDAVQAANMLIAKGVKRVIVTMGKQGAILVSKHGHARIPAFSVPTVDTTGAGDSFTAAFTVGVTKGMDEVDAATFASKVAALVVKQKGAIPSMPLLEEVEGFKE